MLGCFLYMCTDTHTHERTQMYFSNKIQLNTTISYALTFQGESRVNTLYLQLLTFFLPKLVTSFSRCAKKSRGRRGRSNRFDPFPGEYKWSQSLWRRKRLLVSLQAGACCIDSQWSTLLTGQARSLRHTNMVRGCGQMLCSKKTDPLET